MISSALPAGLLFGMPPRTMTDRPMVVVICQCNASPELFCWPNTCSLAHGTNHRPHNHATCAMHLLCLLIAMVLLSSWMHSPFTSICACRRLQVLKQLWGAYKQSCRGSTTGAYSLLSIRPACTVSWRNCTGIVLDPNVQGGSVLVKADFGSEAEHVQATSSLLGRHHT